LWQQYVSLRDSQPKTLFFRFPPSAEFRALLTESKNFQIRDTVSAIPVPVRASFAKNARQESFAMAEPGADWNVTDVMVKPGLPFYRLGKVALSKSLCILFYEEGGFGWSYRVDVFQVARTRPTWCGAHIPSRPSTDRLISLPPSTAESSSQRTEIV